MTVSVHLESTRRGTTPKQAVSLRVRRFRRSCFTGTTRLPGYRPTTDEIALWTAAAPGGLVKSGGRAYRVVGMTTSERFEGFNARLPPRASLRI